jgi:HK97 family phage prohead protease
VETKALADLAWSEAAEGAVRATFSRFGVVDRDGDVTKKSAFTDGQDVPMVRSHDWSRPIGKGTIRVLDDRAVFDGRFFLDTIDGLDAYKTVKNLAELQQYSYGFQVLEAEDGTHEGKAVRVLKRLEVFEVSPVLVGAGIGTRTERIKALAEMTAELKVGRRLSAATRAQAEAMLAADRDRHEAFVAMMTAFLQDPDSDPEEAAAPEAAKSVVAITLEEIARRRARYGIPERS